MILLTMAGGFQDSYSYLMRGEVFANAQTGNIVLLAHHLIIGDFKEAINYIIPLMSFILGVYLTVPISFKFSKKKRLHWMQIVIGIEVLILLIVGFIPTEYDIVANSLMNFTCAMQVNTFRTFRGLPVASTMCIGNMRSGVDLLAKYHATKDKTYKKQGLHYFFIIFIFFLGASLGSLFSIIIGLHAIWLSASILSFAFIYMFFVSDIML